MTQTSQVKLDDEFESLKLDSCDTLFEAFDRITNEKYVKSEGENLAISAMIGEDNLLYTLKMSWKTEFTNNILIMQEYIANPSNIAKSGTQFIIKFTMESVLKDIIITKCATINESNNNLFKNPEAFPTLIKKLMEYGINDSVNGEYYMANHPMGIYIQWYSCDDEAPCYSLIINADEFEVSNERKRENVGKLGVVYNTKFRGVITE